MGAPPSYKHRGGAGDGRLRRHPLDNEWFDAERYDDERAARYARREGFY